MTLTPTATTVPLETPPRVDGTDLLTVSVTVVIIGGLAFVVGRHDGGSAVSGMRLFLWCWIFGMIGYALYGFGVLDVGDQLGAGGPVLAGIVAGLLPLAVYATLGRLFRREQA